MAKNHDILGVGPHADPAQIKRAYRELVRTWHPDRFASDEALQKKAQDKLSEINRAFEELTRDAVRGASREPVREASQTPYTFYSSEPVTVSRGPWPLIAALLILVVLPLAGWGLYSLLRSPRQMNPSLLTQEAQALSTSGVHRYAINDLAHREVYIIEGPRVPLDWEIEALVDTYRSQSPRRKQTIGTFTISQAMKPGDRNLKPLSFHPKKTDHRS